MTVQHLSFEAGPTRKYSETGPRGSSPRIPTVTDRVAQMVVKQELEPVLEREFHPDPNAYRLINSVLAAVRQKRARCRHREWVLDMDIKACIDTIDHELLMKAVRRRTDQKWVLSYIESLANGTGDPSRWNGSGPGCQDSAGRSHQPSVSESDFELRV